MKAKKISNDKVFEPISIKITLETELEAKTMYHLFNHAGTLEELDSEAIRTAISPGGVRATLYDSDFHKRLWADIKRVVK